MSFVIDVDKIKKEPGAYAGSWGTQCVALVQLAQPTADSLNPPATSLWRRGIKVQTAAPNAIKKGTVIATFTLVGLYPSGSEGQRHAAVYLSHDPNGITVIDQWATKTTPSERVLTFGGPEKPRSVNHGDHYYVVELTLADTESVTTNVNQPT